MNEFQGVVDDIHNHLRNPVLISVHMAGFHLKIHLHIQVFLLDIRHPADEHPAQQLVDVKVRPLQLLHPIVHAAELQQIADKPLEAVGFVKNNLQIRLPILLGNGAVQHAFHKTMDAGNGRTQFVAHVGDKLLAAFLHGFQLLGHHIESPCQLANLVYARYLGAHIQFATAHGFRSAGDHRQGFHNAAGIQRSTDHGHDGSQCEAYHHLHQQAVVFRFNDLRAGMNQYRALYPVVLLVGHSHRHDDAARSIDHLGAHFLTFQHIQQQVGYIVCIHRFQRVVAIAGQKGKVVHHAATAVHNHNIGVVIVIYALGLPLQVLHVR